MSSEPGRRSRAAIVSVGDELLWGETVDTNAAWLGRMLAARGIPVVRRWTVGDEESEIREALRAALESAELVLVTGGLGPTPDDRTKEAVASHLGRSIVPDEAARVQVEARFRAAGLDEVPPLSTGQSEIPEGARVLRNPEGTAPGLLLVDEGRLVALFPGVPSELRAIVEGDFAAVLDGVADEPVHHRLVHTTGIFETRLAEALEPAIVGLPEAVRVAVSVAYLPDLLGVDLRLTVRGGDAVTARRLLDAWLEGTAPVLERWRFESDGGDLAEAVVERLRGAEATLAVAESCTGGLVGKRITDVPGASDVFLGGIIAYADEAKVEHVGVPVEELERHGAVSEVVARRLAEGAARRFGARIGVGVTGVAGPGGGSPEKPVGTVWIAVSLDGAVEAELGRYPGDRASVRARSAQAALAAVHWRLRTPGRG